MACESEYRAFLEAKKRKDNLPKNPKTIEQLLEVRAVLDAYQKAQKALLRCRIREIGSILR